MHEVILSLASNWFQKPNLLKARQCLGKILSEPAYTTELWTKPIGTTRKDMYLNQLATGLTSLSPEELNRQLKALETALGRTPEKRLHGIVPIDLDILRYDGQRLHENDWERPYVQQLINEL